LLPKYSREPVDINRFNKRFQLYYNLIAKSYDWCVKTLPFWKRWLRSVLPFVKGENVLEVGFGTGYLLILLAEKYTTTGIDLNEKMLEITKQNLQKANQHAIVLRADATKMPFDNGSFETVVATMSFPAIADIENAVREIRRILKPNGRLLIVTVNYPQDKNRIGNLIIRFWKLSGEVVRDVSTLLSQNQFSFSVKSLGAFGSVQLYVAEKL
jgi:ubiquinone/menaquinone biosynthesis C-methylase UbiE